MQENFNRIMRAYTSSHDIRRFGCSALELCYLAAGRADGMFEYGVKPWDIAAGILILAEAARGTGFHDAYDAATIPFFVLLFFVLALLPP